MVSLRTWHRPKKKMWLQLLLQTFVRLLKNQFELPCLKNVQKNLMVVKRSSFWFQPGIDLQVLVEIFLCSFKQASNTLRRNPTHVYGELDKQAMKCLVDTHQIRNQYFYMLCGRYIMLILFF